MVLISLTPAKDMCKVLGIGVAVRVRMSTWLRICLSLSLCITPNRCSSSIITRPRSLNLTSFWTKRCVPIHMSIVPSFSASKVFFCSKFDLNRLRTDNSTGKAFILSKKVS